MIDQNDIITFSSDRSQIVNYNNPLFRCFSQEIYFPKDSTYHVTEHWHEDIEYLYVKEGSFECTINGTVVILHQGEGICINSKRIHSNRAIKETHCILYCAITHPVYLNASEYINEKYLSPILSPSSFDFVILKKGDWTEAILDLFVNLFEKPLSTPLELKIIETSYHILGILYQNLKPQNIHNKTISPYEDTFKTMVTYISKHYSEKIALGDIANAANIGKTLCAKIFKKYSSKTPGEYVIHYRITKSMELLANNNLSITDIAFTVGFTSASHYTEIFKKLIGCTPNQFRKKIDGAFLSSNTTIS